MSEGKKYNQRLRAYYSGFMVEVDGEVWRRLAEQKRPAIGFMAVPQYLEGMRYPEKRPENVPGEVVR